jgi:hypothetical protein
MLYHSSPRAVPNDLRAPCYGARFPADIEFNTDTKRFGHTKDSSNGGLGPSRVVLPGLTRILQRTFFGSSRYRSSPKRKHTFGKDVIGSHAQCVHMAHRHLILDTIGIHTISRSSSGSSINSAIRRDILCGDQRSKKGTNSSNTGRQLGQLVDNEISVWGRLYSQAVEVRATLGVRDQHPFTEALRKHWLVAHPWTKRLLDYMERHHYIFTGTQVAVSCPVLHIATAIDMLWLHVPSNTIHLVELKVWTDTRYRQGQSARYKPHPLVPQLGDSPYEQHQLQLLVNKHLYDQTYLDPIDTAFVLRVSSSGIYKYPLDQRVSALHGVIVQALLNARKEKKKKKKKEVKKKKKRKTETSHPVEENKQTKKKQKKNQNENKQG